MRTKQCNNLSRTVVGDLSGNGLSHSTLVEQLDRVRGVSDELQGEAVSFSLHDISFLIHSSRGVVDENFPEKLKLLMEFTSILFYFLFLYNYGRKTRTMCENNRKQKIGKTAIYTIFDKWNFYKISKNVFTFA